MGGSLRAIEAAISMLLAAVAVPLLASAAEEDRARLRDTIEVLGKGAVIAGALIMLVTGLVAESGTRFKGAGDA